MVKVTIWGSLQSATEGQKTVEVDAKSLGDLLARLSEAYPGLEPQMRRGVSISIDGRIYNDSWFTPISDDSEVVLLPRLTGG